jgi:hypothetical protein
MGQKGGEPVANVTCPECGAENWIENQSRCFRCQAVLRRCMDCASYDRSRQFCRERQTDVDSYEAEHPGVLAMSAMCDRFRYLGPGKAG